MQEKKKKWIQKLNSYFADFEQVVILLTTKQLVRPPLVTYPSLCSTCVTYGTLCHAIGHQLPPTQPCYRECYRFERAFFTLRRFLPYTPSCFFLGFPGSRQFISRLAGLHADLRNIAPAQLFVRITAIHKSFIQVGSI